MSTGISSIGIHIPGLYITVEELALLRNVDPEKYLIGLGCGKIALCPRNYGIAELALEAAQRALDRWDGDRSKIGLLAVGTESSLDMSRPLSAWIAEKLHLQGRIRSYEVKHACYGGTLATRQAVEWKLAGQANDKAALVIAADIAMYAQGDPGEPTGGAGAVAFIIDEPQIAEIEPLSYPYSKPVFDFWRPIHQEFPTVQGELSLACYKEAVLSCFKDYMGTRDLESILNEFDAVCFHTPFPKMVRKAFFALCQAHGWDEKRIEEYYARKVEHTMTWNKETGNAYTASLWLAVAKTLNGMASGKKIAAFSYGSGCGAELLTLISGPKALKGEWVKDIEKDFAVRKEVKAGDYLKMREDIA